MNLAFCNDQRSRQMTLTSFGERPLEGGAYGYLKLKLLERFLRDSPAGAVMGSHIQAPRDVTGKLALGIDRWQENA
jgi:hypothetical protein